MYSLAIGKSQRLEAGSKDEMRRILVSEKDFWSDFLNQASSSGELLQFFRHNQKEVSQINAGYEYLNGLLDGVGDFNEARIGGSFYHSCLIMPLSSSLEGGAIHGAFTEGLADEANRIFLAYLVELGLTADYNNAIKSSWMLGVSILASIRLQKVVDHQKVDGRKITGYLRRIEASAKHSEEAARRLEEKDISQQGEIQKLNSRYDEMTNVILEKVLSKFNRFHELAARERSILAAQNEAYLASRQESSRVELEKLASLRNKIAEDFHDLHAMFHKHLQYQRPSALWRARAQEHNRKASSALTLFWGLVTLVCVVVVVLFYVGFGRYVSSSFSSIRCDNVFGVFCEIQFSYEGPLLVASILLVSSLFLWLIRLQYRIYLSERHLGLVADERKAFAETYLAMRGDDTVGQENEGIVLSALFRPTQDGIVKDDDGGFDVSAAAMIARQLGGKPQ